jgi:multiple sugar transport system ATP-binding protein
VELIEALGADTLVYAQVSDGQGPGAQLVARQNTRSPLRLGDAVGLDVVPAAFHLFDRQGRALRAPQAPGAPAH